MYVLIDKNGKMRAVETILRIKGGRIKENDEQGEFKIYCKHFCKCHKYPQNNNHIIIKK
jgi:hypothetical protein